MDSSIFQNNIEFKNDVNIYDLRFTVSLIAAVLGTLLLTSKVLTKENHFQSRDFVTINLSTINSKNRPVIGAKIFIDDTYIGRTDSYGKYRFHSRLLLGKEISVKTLKKVAGHLLQGQKMVLIPKKRSYKGYDELYVSAKLEQVEALAQK